MRPDDAQWRQTRSNGQHPPPGYATTEALLYLHQIASFHPENIIDNDFLERLGIGSDSEWILERVGIRERRTVLPLEYIAQTMNADPSQASRVSQYSNCQTGAAAARTALDMAGLQKEQIGLVIAGGCSPQQLIPAEACTIAAELGIRAPAFDISSACSSFAIQLCRLFDTRPEKLPDYILVINAENNTRTVDYRDRSTAVLWGDCSTACILSPKIPGTLKIARGFFDSDPGGCHQVTIPCGGHFSQNGRAVQSFAVRKTLNVLEQLGFPHGGEEVGRSFFIGHQANLTMLQSVCRHYGIDSQRHWYNVDYFGNCGAAGAPSVLGQNMHRLEDGDQLYLIVVGSGLTWGGLVFQKV